MKDKGGYQFAFDAMHRLDPAKVPAAWRALGLIDTLSHAHRLTMPVLLTAGGDDTVCPPASIQSLFERLPGTRSCTFLAGQAHAYTPAFLHLTAAWFGMYV